MGKLEQPCDIIGVLKKRIAELERRFDELEEVLAVLGGFEINNNHNPIQKGEDHD